MYRAELTLQKATLTCLNQQAGALTRRSAGLPNLITSVLAASMNDELFDRVMIDLQRISSIACGESEKVEEKQLPQVHALNCLKDIFTDARFRDRVELYVSASFEIAVDKIESTRYLIGSLQFL